MDGEEDRRKKMKIEVKARLFLTMPMNKTEKEVDEIILKAEHHINKNSLMIINNDVKNHIGIRIHIEK